MSRELSITPKLAATVQYSQNDLMLKNKVIVVIMAAMPHRDFVYHTACELGVKLIFVDDKFPQWMHKYAHEMLYCPEPSQADSVIHVLEDYLEKQHNFANEQQQHSTKQFITQFDGIVSFDDYSVVSTAAVCEYFGLPGLTPEIVELIKHKHKFRLETIKAQIPAPRSLPIRQSYLQRHVYRDLFDPTIQERPWSFPIVLKPQSGAGSHFVKLIKNYQELYDTARQYYSEATATNEVTFWSVKSQSVTPSTTNSSSATLSSCASITSTSIAALSHPATIGEDKQLTPDPSPPLQEQQPYMTFSSSHSSCEEDDFEISFMIEEFITGQEVDIDLVVEHGIIKFMGIADNYPTRGPPGLFLEAGGAQPSALPQNQQEVLFSMTRQLVSHFGTQLHGVFHFEAIYNPITNEAIPIEMNLRLGGSEVLTFCLAVYNVHLGLQALKLCVGIPIEDLNCIPRMQCCSTNILAVESGYIEEVKFLPQFVTENPHFQGGLHRIVPGQALKSPPLAWQYCAWMVASGDTLEDAQKNLEHAVQGFYCKLRLYDKDDTNGIIPGTDKWYLEGTGRENWETVSQRGHGLHSYTVKNNNNNNNIDDNKIVPSTPILETIQQQQVHQ